MRKTLFILTIIFIAIFSYRYGVNIPIKEQWPLYESLRNTSAIIFGVMGAWIAILYPLSVKSDQCENGSEMVSESSIRKLIMPMLYSTLILSAVLIVGFLSPILSQIPILVTYKQVVRGCSFSFLGVLTFAQLWAILLSLMPNDLVFRIVQVTKKYHAAKKVKMPYLKKRK